MNVFNLSIGLMFLGASFSAVADWTCQINGAYQNISTTAADKIDFVSSITRDGMILNGTNPEDGMSGLFFIVDGKSHKNIDGSGRTYTAKCVDTKLTVTMTDGKDIYTASIRPLDEVGIFLEVVQGTHTRIYQRVADQQPGK